MSFVRKNVPVSFIQSIVRLIGKSTSSPYQRYGAVLCSNTARYQLNCDVRGLLRLSDLVHDRYKANHRTHGVSRNVYSGFTKSLRQTLLLFSSSRPSSSPRWDEPESDNRRESDGEGDDNPPLKLMSFPAVVWPSPIKLLRNRFLSLLIRSYFDEKFSIDSFLTGAQQAVTLIAGLISNGQFDDLEGLVSREAIQEVRHNFLQLTASQKAFIAIDPKDILNKFIYEIGMIFDDNSGQRFVEITAVFHGYRGYDHTKPVNLSSLSPSEMYVCNYRFIREFTKGKEDDWTVNKLNHFLPAELNRL